MPSHGQPKEAGKSKGRSGTGPISGSLSAPDRTKKSHHPAMAVEEARKADIDRSVRFLQRLHDVEGGGTQVPTAAQAYDRAAKLASGASEPRRLGGAPALGGPLGGGGAAALAPVKKPSAESVRDKRAAYFNRMFAAEVGDAEA
jgi:hypothetical protein